MMMAEKKNKKQKTVTKKMQKERMLNNEFCITQVGEIPHLMLIDKYKVFI